MLILSFEKQNVVLQLCYVNLYHQRECVHIASLCDMNIATFVTNHTSYEEFLTFCVTCWRPSHVLSVFSWKHDSLGINPQWIRLFSLASKPLASGSSILIICLFLRFCLWAWFSGMFVTTSLVQWYVCILSQMQQQGILKSDELITRFFRVCTGLCVEHTYNTLKNFGNPSALLRAQCFKTLDAYVRLIVLLVKLSGDSTNTMTKINLLNKVMCTAPQERL